ncbi:TetR/AcrR family transcriptional regulator [uncultured Corynebacterium sp.]|uniref:TetR/AcrR family transcriptional regulator n=1 Tax=uncultured Corynebacterium sp. TaxID=159447 RepID=UPI0025E9BE3B|nr:TetR/AcrR family transcriptional regulator [uncultured Corynebacterium sp.]
MTTPSTRTANRDRAAMSEEILDAAEELLRRDIDGSGIPPLTLGDVAKKVGLARSSLYRYHAGVEDLIEAVAMRGFEEWVEGCRERVSTVKAERGPRAAILAFVDANIRRGPHGDLRWRHQLLRVHLDEESFRRVSERHGRGMELLEECVREIDGVADDCRGTLFEALRALINGGVVVAADHPDDVERFASLYERAADAMLDSVGAA